MNIKRSFAFLVVVVGGLVPQILFGQVRILKERTIILDTLRPEFSVVDLLPTTADAFLVLSSSMFENRIMKVDAVDNVEWETWYGTPDSAINFQRMIKLETGGYGVVGAKRVPVTPSSGVITRLQLSENGDVLGHSYRQDSACLLQAVGPLDIHSNGDVATAGRLIHGGVEQRRSLYVAWTDPTGKRISESLYDPYDRDSMIADNIEVLEGGYAVILGRSRRKIKFTPKFYYDAFQFWYDRTSKGVEGSTHLSSDTNTALIPCLAKLSRDSVALFFEVSYHLPSNTPPQLGVNYSSLHAHITFADMYPGNNASPSSAVALTDGSLLMVGYLRDSDTSLGSSVFYAAHIATDGALLWDSSWGISGTKNVLQEVRIVDGNTYIAAGYQGPDSARNLYYVRFGLTPLHVPPHSSNEFAALYPNPAGDRVTIALTTAQGEADVEVRSVLGHKVLEGLLTSSTGNELSLDIRQLVRGSYFVVLKFTDGKRSVLPLVIDR